LWSAKYNAMQLLNQRISIPRKYLMRWLIIFVCYTIFAIALFCIIFLVAGPKGIYENYGPPDQRLLNIVHNIVKCTIIYYFIIFWIFLPILQACKFGKILSKLSQLILFFLVLTAYEYLIVFKTKDSAAERQHLTLFNYMFWELLIGTIITLFCLSISIMIELRNKAERQRELEKGKLSAELSALKYQINPHFLFNCLNFIYTKTVRQNAEVANAVNLLSEIMRYVLREDEDKNGMVLLSTEIGHMKNVIEINQMRFNNNLKLRFLEDIDDLNVHIPPLILITLLENAFKHGDLGDDNYPLSIKLEVIREKLWFYIQNKKRKGNKELSSGIGLVNVQQRLQMMYGVRHNFQIREDEQFYVAELTINL